MDKVFEKLFGEFTITNFIIWLKELFLFYKQPFAIINRISNKNSSDIFSQFLFYFIFSNSFYFLFIRKDNHLLQNFNLALDGLLSSFLSIILLALSSKIITGKNNLKKIVLSLLVIQFSCTPIRIIIYSNFIRFENYVFFYISNIFSSLILIGIACFWAFAIERNTKKAMKMILLNIVLLNTLQFFLFFIKVDPYAQETSIINRDPIYDDYRMIIENLYSKEKIPTATVYNNITAFDSLNKVSIYDRVMVTTFDGKQYQSKTTFALTKQLKSDFKVNLNNLKALDTLITFQRNKIILKKWEDHFGLANQLMAEKVTYKYYFENIKKLEKVSENILVEREVSKTLILNLMNLEDYNNSILFHHKRCYQINMAGSKLIYIPAYLLDTFLDKFRTFPSGELKYNFDKDDLDEDYSKYSTE